jgi:type IV secretory pathway VirB10-like protein
MIATTVNDSGMKNSLAVSAVLHIVLLILLYVGLPVLFRPPPQHHDPMPFEIVDISEITNTRVKPEDEQMQPPAPPPKPAPKTQTAPTPPAPQPAEQKTEALSVPKPIEKPKPQVEKPKPDPLASVLRNVAKMKTEQASKTNTQDTTQKQEEVKTVAPSLSDRLTISELDALRRQMRDCWLVPIGARDIQNLVVEVVIAVNPDRTVARADVVDTARMASDSFFRAAAESAVRALFNPKCTPLELPPDQYEKWKVIDFTFDPRDM